VALLLALPLVHEVHLEVGHLRLFPEEGMADHADEGEGRGFAGVDLHVLDRGLFHQAPGQLLGQGEARFPGRAFRQVLGNTLVANVTASYLWFALTFWAYLETRSVMATAIIGGGYMLFTAVFGTFFGTLVDRHRKKQVMVISSTVTLVAYAASAAKIGMKRMEVVIANTYL